MPPSRWSALITFAHWARELGVILAGAEDVIREGDFEAKLALHDLLTEYIKESPTAAEPLDAIARRTSRDILEAQVAEAAARIAARNAELRQATRLIEEATAQGKRSDRDLQFESVVNALEKAKAGLEVLKKLEDAATEPDRELVDRLTAVANAIAEFEKLARE